MLCVASQTANVSKLFTLCVAVDSILHFSTPQLKLLCRGDLLSAAITLSKGSLRPVQCSVVRGQRH